MMKKIFISHGLFFCRASNFTRIVYENVCCQDCRDKTSKPAAGNFSHESATDNHLQKADEVKYISVKSRRHVLPKIRFINIKSLLVRWCIGWLLFHTLFPFRFAPSLPKFWRTASIIRGWSARYVERFNRKFSGLWCTCPRLFILAHKAS